MLHCTPSFVLRLSSAMRQSCGLASSPFSTTLSSRSDAVRGAASVGAVEGDNDGEAEGGGLGLNVSVGVGGDGGEGEGGRKERRGRQGGGTNPGGAVPDLRPRLGALSPCRRDLWRRQRCGSEHAPRELRPRPGRHRCRQHTIEGQFMLADDGMNASVQHFLQEQASNRAYAQLQQAC